MRWWPESARPAPGLLRLLVFLEQSQVVGTVFPESAPSGQAGDGFGPIEQLEGLPHDLGLPVRLPKPCAGQQQVELRAGPLPGDSIRPIEESPVRVILPRLLRHLGVERQGSLADLDALAQVVGQIDGRVDQAERCTAPSSWALSSLSCRRHGKPAVCSCQMPLHLDEHRHQDKHRTRAAAATGAAEASRGWRRRHF